MRLFLHYHKENDIKGKTDLLNKYPDFKNLLKPAEVIKKKKTIKSK